MSQITPRRLDDDNLYYCLATLNGTGHQAHPENTRDWNIWAARALGKRRSDELSKKRYAIDPHFTSENIKEIERKFHERVGRNVPLPDSSSVVDFSNTEFRRDVNFSGFVFPTHINGKNSTFRGRVDLNKIYAEHLVQLDGSLFSSGFSCYLAEFNTTFSALDSVFQQNVFFNKSRFGSEFLAQRSAFQFGLGLEGCVFDDLATLRDCNFGSDMSASDAVFEGEADFSFARFAGGCMFTNAKFRRRTSFEGTRFLLLVPDFRGADLHDATEFHDAHWPEIPKSKGLARAQFYAYEKLALEMDRLKKQEDKLFFFRKSLRLRRNIRDSDIIESIINWLYWASSEYGHSISRPLYGLLFTIAVGSLAIRDVGLPGASAFWFSIANTFPFLPLKRDLESPTDLLIHQYWFNFISTSQSIVGILLLFLFIVAIRNRFRIG